MKIDLASLLKSRDERYSHQAGLLSRFPGKTLVCMTVVFPGDVKRDSRTLTVAQAGLEALRKEFSERLHDETRDLETGFEAYLVVDQDSLEAKRRCCAIEDTHPLGRLMDIDVLQSDPVIAPLGREAVGLEPRCCLVCNRPARECVRSRAHSHEELIARIDEILNFAR